jgi:hypothetical protein
VQAWVRTGTELNIPEVVAKLEIQGMSSVGGTPGEFGKMMSAELKHWTEVARQANVDCE